MYFGWARSERRPSFPVRSRLTAAIHRRPGEKNDTGDTSETSGVAVLHSKVSYGTFIAIQ